MKKYAWASITKSCENFGNFVIEKNLLNLLESSGIGSPDFEFDAFKSQSDNMISKINSYGFIVVPGCTTIALKDYPGIESILGKINNPIFNIGASLPTNRKVGDINKLKHFFSPIGSRDPYTNRFLVDNGINSRFIGCPTMFTGEAKVPSIKDNDKIVYIMSPRVPELQIEIIQHLINHKKEIEVFWQDKYQKEILEKNNISYSEYSAGNVIESLNNARLVITGRLHGTLPALALGTPSLFLQTKEDTRFTLLDYLKIKRFDINLEHIKEIIDEKIENPNSHTSNDTYFKLEELRTKFLSYLDIVKDTVDKL